MIEIGDGTGDSQHAIMRAGGQIHPAHRHFESSFSAVVKRAEGSKLSCRNLRVIKSALALDLSRLLHSFAYLKRCVAVTFAAEFFIGHSRNFDVQIDAIE